MRIKFCGAAREVTGSSHLLTLDNGYKILLDCGLYQGHSEQMEEFNSTWLFNPTEIDCLILSHAHIDHCGRIPKLVKDGFRGNIYCTPATRGLTAIMLMDSAGIQERDAEYFNKNRHKHGLPERLPLYESKDVVNAMKLFVNVGYDRSLRIHDDIELVFTDAGHILGSASVTLRIKEGKKTKLFGFTGDLGRPNRPILRDPQPMPEVDYLLCESTYGDREHPSAPDELNRFADILNETCVKRHGKVIIPAFSVGRTQEIVYMMDRLAHAGRMPRVPVYVDSPLSVNATDIFLENPDCFDADLQRYLINDDNPFGFSRLKYIREVEESKKLNESREPCIIISASGMANAGRVKHHIFNNVENPHNTILIVGYCTPDTPGGKLRDGAKMLRLFGEDKEVNARVEIMDSFSAHGDRKEMLHTIENQKEGLKRMFLVHGELEKQEAFKKYLQERGFGDVEIPELGQSFQL